MLGLLGLHPDIFDLHPPDMPRTTSQLDLGRMISVWQHANDGLVLGDPGAVQVLPPTHQGSQPQLVRVELREKRADRGSKLSFSLRSIQSSKFFHQCRLIRHSDTLLVCRYRCGVHQLHHFEVQLH